MSDRHGFRPLLKGSAGFVASIIMRYMEMDNKPEFEWVRFDKLGEKRMRMLCGIGDDTVVARVEIQFEEVKDE